MNAFLWVIIILGFLDLAGRIFRLYTGARTVTTVDIVCNIFVNLGLAVWAAYLLGGRP